MKRLDIFKLFKAAPKDGGPKYDPPFPKEYWDQHPHLQETVKQPGWLSITPEGTHSDEEVNVEGKRPLTQKKVGQLKDESRKLGLREGKTGGYAQDMTPEKLQEILGTDQTGATAQMVRAIDQLTGQPPRHIGEHGWDHTYSANQEVRDRNAQHYPELRNSALDKLFKVAPAESDSNPEHEKLRRDVKKPGWLSVTPTPNDIRSDEEVNEEGERPLTHEALGRLGEGIMDRTEGLGGGYSQDTTPEELEEMKRVEDKKQTQERVGEAFRTHPELRNSSAVQNLLKYAIENAFVEELTEAGKKEPEQPKAKTSPYGGKSPAVPPTEEQVAEHERIMTDLGEQTTIAQTAQSQRIKEQAERQAREDAKPQSEREHLTRGIKNLPSNIAGGVGSASRFATEVGGAAAATDRSTAGQMAQGPLQGSPGGVGTGRASGINRAKIAQKPLGTAGKVPSMSTKVAQQKQPRVSQPSRTHQMMEKEYKYDKHEEEYEEHNVKERKPKSKMGVSGKGVQNLQRLIGERSQQVKDKKDN